MAPVFPHRAFMTHFSFNSTLYRVANGRAIIFTNNTSSDSKTLLLLMRYGLVAYLGLVLCITTLEQVLIHLKAKAGASATLYEPFSNVNSSACKRSARSARPQS